MRKYQYKESYAFARLLGNINAVQTREECGVNYFKRRPFMLLKTKIRFYILMFKVRIILEKLKDTNLISQADFIKLLDMWIKIWTRKYEPRY